MCCRSSRRPSCSISSCSWWPRLHPRGGTARRDRPGGPVSGDGAAEADGHHLHRRLPGDADPARHLPGRASGFRRSSCKGMPSDIFWLGVIALTLSYGAYVAEVIRAGIASIHPSQWSAGRVARLHLRARRMRHVVLPQAFRRVVPPLINDFVSLQKDTALVATAGLVEILRKAQINSSRDFNFTPYVVAALFFIALTVPLARLRRLAGAAAGTPRAGQCLMALLRARTGAQALRLAPRAARHRSDSR